MNTVTAVPNDDDMEVELIVQLWHMKHGKNSIM